MDRVTNSGGEVAKPVSKRMDLVKRTCFILILLFVLSACQFSPGVSPYDALEVSKGDIAEHETIKRIETDKSPSTLYVEYEMEGSGEQDAKRVFAEALSMYQEHYSCVMMVIKKDNNNKSWSTIFIDNEDAITGLKRKNHKEFIEKKIQPYFKMAKEEGFPYITFFEGTIE